MQRDLVEAARGGDHGAFVSIASAAASRLHAVAWCILRDSSLAEDAVQDALFHAWRQLPRLRDPERWDAWLHRLIVNACTDLLRHRRRDAVEVRLLQEPVEPDSSSAVADRDELERAFRRLDAQQRAAIALRYYLDLPVTEVADALGVPLGTAKSRIHHATTALRAALEADARAVPVLHGRRSA